jgi:diguanylate cyclase (GGDEF)-like protein/PAS domain S-box-containing protein
LDPKVLTALGSDQSNVIIDGLLALDPPIRVAALADNGLCIAMPSTVPLRGHLVPVEQTSALELVCEDDVVAVIHAWDEVVWRGASSAIVHLLDAPDTEVSLHYVDARARWGVYLRFIVGEGEPTTTRATSSDLLRPRVGVIIKNGIANVISCDDALSRMLGWVGQDIAGMRSVDLVHPDDQAKAIAIWMDMLANPGAVRRVRLRHLRGDGDWQWVEITNENLINDPDHRHVRAEIVDISEEMTATEALRTGELLLRQVTDSLPVGIAQVDDVGRVIYCNDRLATVLGRTITNTDDLLDCVDHRVELAVALQAVRSGTAVDVQVDVPADDGSRHVAVSVRGLVNNAGEATGALLCLSDVTEATRLREELAFAARVDELTGCLRRSAAIDHIDWLLTSPDHPAQSVTVLFVDLDGFKAINDRHGHAAGDALLREVGHRLRASAGPRDVVGRLGGDEFVVVIPDLASGADAHAAGLRVNDLLRSPAEVGGQSMVAHASVGTAWTAEGLDADTLVARADAQMYLAKRRLPDRRRA